MSNWAYAMDWLTATGLACLAIGTYAQAWGAIKEYNSLLHVLPEAGRKALHDNLSPPMLAAVLKQSVAESFIGPQKWYAPSPPVRYLWKIITDVPRNLAKISAASGDTKDAVRVAELIRTATIWLIITEGSVLILAAAVIQLLLAYNLI